MSTPPLLVLVLAASFLVIPTLSQSCGTSGQVFVSDTGIDEGLCDSAAPCASIAFALSQVTIDSHCLQHSSLTLLSSIDGSLDGNANIVLSNSMTNLGNQLTISAFSAYVTLEADDTFIIYQNAGFDLVLQGIRVRNGMTGVSYSNRDPERTLTLNEFEVTGTKQALFISTDGHVNVLKFAHLSSTGTSQGCASMDLNLGASSNATLSFISVTDVAPGSAAFFCINSEPTSVVSISDATASQQQQQNLSDLGGAFFLYGGMVSFDRLFCRQLVASFGSCIYAQDMGSLIIERSSFSETGSRLTEAGGALYVTSRLPDSTFKLANCSSKFTASGGYAAGFLYLLGQSSAQIMDSTLEVSSCQFGFGGFVTLMNTTNTAFSNVQFSDGSASQGSVVACFSSTATTMEYVEMIDSKLTSIGHQETIDMVDFNCTSDLWNLGSTCPQSRSCSSCDSSVCGQTLTSCSCYCTGVDGEECDSGQAPASTPWPSRSVSVTMTPPRAPSLSLTSASGQVASSGESLSSTTTPLSLPVGTVVTILAIASVIALVILLVFVVGGFGYYMKSHQATVLPASYETIEMAPPVTPQRDDDKYQYEVEEDKEAKED